MTDNRIEREAVHPLALNVLDGCIIYHGDLNNRVHYWETEGHPLLSPRTKAILEEVEEAMKICNALPNANCPMGGDGKCTGYLTDSIHQTRIECPLAGIRRAYEKGERP